MNEEQPIVLLHSWSVAHAMFISGESVASCTPKSDMREASFLDRKVYEGQLFFSSV